MILHVDFLKNKQWEQKKEGRAVDTHSESLGRQIYTPKESCPSSLYREGDPVGASGAPALRVERSRPSGQLGPEHTGHFVQPHVAAHCGGDIYSCRKPLFSSFGEHTAVCGSSVRQAVARPRHRQSVCIHNIHVAATCRPSVLGSATMRGHMWLNKVASVLGPLGGRGRLITTTAVGGSQPTMEVMR